MPGPAPPNVEAETLRRLLLLEQQFNGFLEEFHEYVTAAREERRELKVFIEDDVRGLLAQLAELARKHYAGLNDLRGALALHLGGPEQEGPREVNGQRTTDN